MLLGKLKNILSKKKESASVVGSFDFMGVTSSPSLRCLCEGKHKPSIVVNGDALNRGAESAVLPFGVEEIKLAKLKE